jgi:Ala-tRNA(Pro) deacylase
MRVADFLAEQHVAFETLLHAPAFTAQRRARVLGISGRQVVKSVLLAGPRGYFLAVLSATRRINLNALAEHFHGPVRLASTSEIADLFLDCEWGVVPPFGRIYGLPTLMDAALAADQPLVFEGNYHAEAVRLLGHDFEGLEQPTRLALSVPTDQPPPTPKISLNRFSR